MYLPILTYHRVLATEPFPAVDPQRIAVSVDQFYDHLVWLKRLGYHSVSLADYGQRLHQNHPHRPGAFAITFDDGYPSVVELALPVLKELGFTATVFAVADRLDSANFWDDGSMHLMSVEQLRAWHQAGMEVGAHTCTHVHLPEVDKNTAWQEISESKKKLEDLLAAPVRILAYPYGESTPEVEQLAKAAGFEAAFATDDAPHDHQSNPYRIRRVVVFPRTTVWEILLKVQPWYPAYQDWKRSRRP